MQYIDVPLLLAIGQYCHFLDLGLYFPEFAILDSDLIAFGKRVTFSFNELGNCLVCLVHKAMTGRIEAKKLLSRLSKAIRL